MSRVAAQAHEPVVPEDRGSMHDARKRRIWARVKGKCWMCGQAVPESGPDVRYDHKIPIELGGADEDWNIYPLHRQPCDELKTKADRKRIDKMRRQQAKLGPDSERTVSPSWGNQRKTFRPPVRVLAKRRKGTAP